jgi:DNA-binding CsgD family transcriptional regulator
MAQFDRDREAGRFVMAGEELDRPGGSRFFLQPLEAPPPACAALLLDEVTVDGSRFRLYRRIEAEADDPTSVLTRREFEIVRRVCLGEPNKRIADRLGISEYTVKTYIKQIFIKLDVHTRSAMVYRCARWVGAEAMAVP